VRSSRSHQLCSQSIVSQHFMEPGGSLLHSLELSNCTYSEPDQSSPHHSILSLQDPAYYTQSYVLVLLLVSFNLTFLPKPILVPFLGHSSYMPRPPRHPLRDDFGEEYKSCSSTLCSVLHSPTTSSLFGPHYHFPKRPQSVTPLMLGTNFYHNIHRQNYSLIYSNF
jgi:hypothetical protein